MVGSLVTAILFALPLGAFAAPNHDSLHRRHHEHARHYVPTRRGTTYKLVDDYNNDTFFEYAYPYSSCG